MDCIEEAAQMGGVDEEDVEEHLRGLMEIGVIREADGRLEVVLEEERTGASANDRDMPGSGIAGATAHHPHNLAGELRRSKPFNGRSSPYTMDWEVSQ